MEQRSSYGLSDFRKKKIEKFFNFLDVNEDGFISVEDYEMVGIYLAQLTNAGPDETSAIRATLLNWWDIVRGQNDKDKKIPLSEFMTRSIRYLTTTDPKVVAENSGATHEEYFSLIDRNRDGVISREELGIFYNSFGVKGKVFIDSIFERIAGKGNEQISRENFVKAFDAFWLSDEPENGYEFLLTFQQTEILENICPRVYTDV